TVRILTVLRPVSITGVVGTTVGARIICIWLILIQLVDIFVNVCRGRGLGTLHKVILGMRGMEERRLVRHLGR
ncbi:hypothetical protein BJY52DRAFT_1316057, partial [Lactarius psammicola]